MDMTLKFGTISKEAFDSLNLGKFMDSDFYKPLSRRKKSDSSCFLFDGKAGTFVYSDAEEGFLIYCYSFKNTFDDEVVFKVGISCLARNTKYGAAKNGYWQAMDGFSYTVKENLKYESSKIRNIVKRISKFMDSKENLKDAFRQNWIAHRDQI